VKRLPALGRWGVYLLVAVAFAIACAFLSHWQFGRNADRSAELALVSENYDAQPVPVETLVQTSGGFDEAVDKWHPVVLTGRYLPDQQLLARNRAHGGTSAFEVLVPFQLDDGRILIVDRGWVPPGEGEGPDSVPAAPQGQATVVGRLLPGEPLPPSGRETAPDGQVPTINLPLIAQRMGAQGAQLDQSAYILMMSEDPAPATAPSALEEPTNDPGPFLSYAVQWILFAVMGFVFIGYVIRTEVQKRREDAAEAAAGGGGVPDEVNAPRLRGPAARAAPARPVHAPTGPRRVRRGRPPRPRPPLTRRPTPFTAMNDSFRAHLR
jgi:cytochrome oxidase assembly protein ShyY1